MGTTLFEHTPEAFAPAGSQLCQQIVALRERDNGQRLVHIGHAIYTLDQARDFIATVMAAVQVGEQAG